MCQFSRHSQLMGKSNFFHLHAFFFFVVCYQEKDGWFWSLKKRRDTKRDYTDVTKVKRSYNLSHKKLSSVSFIGRKCLLIQIFIIQHTAKRQKYFLETIQDEIKKSDKKMISEPFTSLFQMNTHLMCNILSLVNCYCR